MPPRRPPRGVNEINRLRERSDSLAEPPRPASGNSCRVAAADPVETPRHGRSTTSAEPPVPGYEDGTDRDDPSEDRCASKALPTTSPPTISASPSMPRSPSSARSWSRASREPARRCSPARSPPRSACRSSSGTSSRPPRRRRASTNTTRSRVYATARSATSGSRTSATTSSAASSGRPSAPRPAPFC